MSELVDVSVRFGGGHDGVPERLEQDVPVRPRADLRVVVSPALSQQERTILVGYVSGLTLDAAARRAGVRPGTAKVYLRRVKEKYRRIGRPANTKLDLARRAQEDGLTT